MLPWSLAGTSLGVALKYFLPLGYGKVVGWSGYLTSLIPVSLGQWRLWMCWAVLCVAQCLETFILCLACHAYISYFIHIWETKIGKSTLRKGLFWLTVQQYIQKQKCEVIGHIVPTVRKWGCGGWCWCSACLPFSCSVRQFKWVYLPYPSIEDPLKTCLHESVLS